MRKPAVPVRTGVKRSDHDEAATSPAASPRPPTREDKKQIAGWFSKDVSRQLRLIGLEEDKSGQALLEEALNLLFAKYKKPPIA